LAVQEIRARDQLSEAIKNSESAVSPAHVGNQEKLMDVPVRFIIARRGKERDISRRDSSRRDA